MDTPIIKCGLKSLIHSQTSTAAMNKLFHPTLHRECDYLSTWYIQKLACEIQTCDGIITTVFQFLHVCCFNSIPTPNSEIYDFISTLAITCPYTCADGMSDNEWAQMIQSHSMWLTLLHFNCRKTIYSYEFNHMIWPIAKTTRWKNKSAFHMDI